MTEGHKHRIVKVKGPAVWWVRIIRSPIYHTRNEAKMHASPYPYCPCDTEVHCWTISTMSLLHRWTGFTLFYRTWKGAPDDAGHEFGQPE